MATTPSVSNDPGTPSASSTATEITAKKWNIWATIEKLEETQNEFYPDVTRRVIPILRAWGEKWGGDLDWRSILNKGTLIKEVEESIVAIHYLLQATTSESGQPKIIVMDVCAGKGFFSFLLSYLKPPQVQEIIMVEKADINWHHIIHGANPTAETEGRPKITIWDNTNLHDYDNVLERLMDLPLPVAMTGIHLCKQLGPSFCGLVNGLGPKCVYACLAPCCVPRAVTAQKNNKNKTSKPFVVSVQLEESHDDRQTRKDYMEMKGRLKKKPEGGPCYYCHNDDHGIIACPILPTLPRPEQVIIRQAFHAATIPCWNCLELGHFKSACPVAVERSTPLSMQAPTTELDVSRVLASDKPYNAYCYLLAESFQNRKFEVIETELESSERHQAGNWNGAAKNIFIVAR